MERAIDTLHTTMGNSKDVVALLVEKQVVPYRGFKVRRAIMPEMMRWLWRDGPVSTDVNDTIERSFRQPVVKKN